MTRRFVSFVKSGGLLAVACSGRLSFDTHALEGTGGQAGAGSGGLEAGHGGVPTGGGSSDDCGGSHPLSRPPAADAGEPAGDEPEELECDEGSGCYPCTKHLDCAYRWLCDPALRVCVECLTDENCAQGTCDVRLRRCH